MMLDMMSGEIWGLGDIEEGCRGVFRFRIQVRLVGKVRGEKEGIDGCLPERRLEKR